MENDIVDRLHCRYAMGPMINGAPEFGYRDFSGPITTTLPTALMLEAAKEIASLREARDVLLAACESALYAMRTAAEELGGTGYFASKADELQAAIAKARGA